MIVLAGLAVSSHEKKEGERVANPNPDLIAVNLARAITSGRHPNPGVAIAVIICCLKCDSAGRLSVAPLLNTDSIESIVAVTSLLGFPSSIIQLTHGKHQGELLTELSEAASSSTFLDAEQLNKMRVALETLRTIETDGSRRIRLDKAISKLGMDS